MNDLDQIKGRTIRDVSAPANKNGEVKSILISFTDGMSLEIDAIDEFVNYGSYAVLDICVNDKGANNE